MCAELACCVNLEAVSVGVGVDVGEAGLNDKSIGHAGERLDEAMAEPEVEGVGSVGYRLAAAPSTD